MSDIYGILIKISAAMYKLNAKPKILHIRKITIK